MSRSTARGLDPWLVGSVLIFVLVGVPAVAQAWGPSVHLWIGDTLLETAGAALPGLVALLRRHARSFLYGCLAPDFFVGKGSTYHEGHCHTWAVGRRLLAEARDEGQVAFAHGYLTHLAADIIGHNHFVPNNLYRTFGVHKLGHVLFELHADNLLHPSYVDLADDLLAGTYPGNDTLLDATIARGRVRLETKKRVFTSWVAIHRHGLKHVLTRARRFSAVLLGHDDVDDLVELSLALALVTLQDPTVPHLGAYDPIGDTNLRLAKELRRESKRARSYRRADVPFPVPAPLAALRESLGALAAPRPVDARVCLPFDRRLIVV